MKIIVISPVRNEEEFLPITIKCMLKQTILPIKWIIVNDGSTDNTEKIIKKYQQKFNFISYLRLQDRGYRKPGQGVVEAFYAGFNSIRYLDFDIVAKFDGDLDFPPETLEKITHSFIKDPKLGITGGTRYERITSNGEFKKLRTPKGYVGGVNKFYRKKCFEDMGGLIKRAGWDGVDIIRAQARGWKTGEIESLKIFHLVPTGTSKGEGLKRACEKYGDVSYYMGGYFWYFILRVLGRSMERKNLFIGLYMLKGYFRSKSQGLGREPERFRHHLRNVQRQNTLYWIKLASKSFVKTIS